MACLVFGIVSTFNDIALSIVFVHRHGRVCQQQLSWAEHGAPFTMVTIEMCDRIASSHNNLVDQEKLSFVFTHFRILLLNLYRLCLDVFYCATSKPSHQCIVGLIIMTTMERLDDCGCRRCCAGDSVTTQYQQKVIGITMWAIHWGDTSLLRFFLPYVLLYSSPFVSWLSC